MLCSLPAVKSGPNWLNRLRSNKGFPIDDELGLDQFLTNQNLHNPSSPHSTPDSTPTNHLFHPNYQPPPPPSPHSSASTIENGNAVITGILSELFIMGCATKHPRISGKKISRKQSKPKICSISSVHNANYMDDKNLENILSSNSDNSLKGVSGELNKELKEQCKPGKVAGKDVEEEVEEEEEEKGDEELIGYSKSEVTIIDTSCDVWKTDKLVFRRKNAWKVKEKKGKSRSYGRKKRKHDSEFKVISDEVASGSKKTKIWRSEEYLKPLNKVHNSQYRTGPVRSINEPDNLNYI